MFMCWTILFHDSGSFCKHFYFHPHLLTSAHQQPFIAPPSDLAVNPRLGSHSYLWPSVMRPPCKSDPSVAPVLTTGPAHRMVAVTCAAQPRCLWPRNTRHRCSLLRTEGWGSVVCGPSDRTHVTRELRQTRWPQDEKISQWSVKHWDTIHQH